MVRIVSAAWRFAGFQIPVCAMRRTGLASKTKVLIRLELSVPLGLADAEAVQMSEHRRSELAVHRISERRHCRQLYQPQGFTSGTVRP